MILVLQFQRTTPLGNIVYDLTDLYKNGGYAAKTDSGGTLLINICGPLGYGTKNVCTG